MYKSCVGGCPSLVVISELKTDIFKWSLMKYSIISMHATKIEIAIQSISSLCTMWIVDESGQNLFKKVFDYDARVNAFREFVRLFQF